MSFAPGRTQKYSAKRLCPKCKNITDHLCSRTTSRQSEEADGLNVLTRVRSCLVCGYGYDQVVEVPMPSEGGMILKRLMTVTNDYYVKRASVTSKGLHAILDVELYPFEREPVVRVIEKLEKDQYINALEFQRLDKAGLKRIYDREKLLKRPMWPSTREEIRARLYKIRPYLERYSTEKVDRNMKQPIQFVFFHNFHKRFRKATSNTILGKTVRGEIVLAEKELVQTEKDEHISNLGRFLNRLRRRSGLARMKKCKKCGYNLTEAQTHCPKCGWRESQASLTGVLTSQPPVSPKCRKCGSAPVFKESWGSLVCEKCDVRVCPSCGGQLIIEHGSNGFICERCCKKESELLILADHPTMLEKWFELMEVKDLEKKKSAQHQ